MNRKFSIFNFFHHNRTLPRRWQFLINKKGIALYLVVLILAGVLTVALGAASLVVSGIVQGRTQTYSIKAYFAAEAGAERMLWEIRKNNFAFERSDHSSCQVGDHIDFNTNPATCLGGMKDYPLPNGANYWVIYRGDTPFTFFWSSGEYQGVRRKVEISY